MSKSYIEIPFKPSPSSVTSNDAEDNPGEKKQ